MRGNHGFLPSRDEVATGFVAAGPGLGQGRVIPVFRQIDIAPLVAHLCDFDMGPGVEGVLVPGVLAQRGRTHEDEH